MALSRQNRITTVPDDAVPALECLGCERPLDYRHTVIGGVSPQERWDIFRCRACGWFEYRHRTRRLRRLPVCHTT